MINDGVTLLDDGVSEWYTVIALCAETMERWAESFNVDTALAAEEKAQEFARERGIHLFVACVLRGKVWEQVDIADGYAKWTDPTCKTQEEMNMLMQELGLWKLGQWKQSDTHAVPEKKWWQK